MLFEHIALKLFFHAFQFKKLLFIEHILEFLHVGSLNLCLFPLASYIASVAFSYSRSEASAAIGDAAFHRACVLVNAVYLLLHLVIDGEKLILLLFGKIEFFCKISASGTA